MAAPPAYSKAEHELAEYIQQHKAEHIELKDMLIKMIKQIEENKKMLRLYTKAVNDAINKMDDKIDTLDRQNQKEHIGLIERLERHESLDLARHAVAAARTQPDAAQQLANPNISGAMAFRICCDTFGRCATTPMVFTSSSTFADMTMEPTAPEMGLYDGALNLASDWGDKAWSFFSNDIPEETSEPQILEYTGKPDLRYLLSNYASIETRGSSKYPAFKRVTPEERKQILKPDRYDLGRLESGVFYKLEPNKKDDPTLYFQASTVLSGSLDLELLNPVAGLHSDHFFRVYFGDSYDSHNVDEINDPPENFKKYPNPTINSIRELQIESPNPWTADPDNLPVKVGAPSDNEGSTLKEIEESRRRGTNY
jgi:hypothetical protein